MLFEDGAYAWYTMTPLIQVADNRTARICGEVARHLAEQFAIAARLYAEAVAQLTRDAMISSVPGEEYDRLAQATREGATNNGICRTRL